MLAAIDLDLMESVSMAIGVQRQTEMNPITIVFAGINDYLHSRGFPSRLREPTTAEAAVWPAIKDILESMGEVVDRLKEVAFTKITPRAVFALSPGYAYLPDGLKFMYAMVALLSEGKYYVIISAANRGKEMENLKAKVLRTKPEANQWLHLTPRIAALGADAFERGPVMIRKIHAYLVKEVSLAENAEEKSAAFVNRVCQVTLETFWTQNVKGEEGFDWTDSMLEGLGAGWTASFLAKLYPSLSQYLIKEFLQVVALFVTFGAENFVKGPAILLTEGVQNLQLDGLLTLIAVTHGNLGGLMNLTRYLEQMRENVSKFDVKRSTDS